MSAQATETTVEATTPDLDEVEDDLDEQPSSDGAISADLVRAYITAIVKTPLLPDHPEVLISHRHTAVLVWSVTSVYPK
mgnify:CR=1 FL=1